MTAFLFKHMVIGIIACVTLLIILVQLLLTVFGGFGDFDTDGGGMDTNGDGGADFDSSIFLSPKGLLHFLAGFSWYLVLINKDTLAFGDYFIGFLVGVVALLAIGLLYWGLSKLGKETIEEKGMDLVGRTVEIYLKTGDSQYDASVTKNGATTMISVQTKDPSDYKTGKRFIITSYEDGIYYIG